MSSRLRLTVAIAAVVAVAVAAAALADTAFSPSRIVAQLNKERAALGIPKVHASSSKTAGCRAHVRYMRLNHTLDHTETPGRAGYSKAGKSAASQSVLAGPRSGWAARNPWINAPIHLSLVYTPELRSTGAFDADGYSCLYVLPRTSGTARKARVFTDPANGGSIAFSQHANEGPYLPQTKVGVPASRTTGPYLLIWSLSPRSKPLKHLVRGSLKGPDGTVAAKVIDSSRLGGIVEPGAGFLLPVRPLTPGATYRATIVLGPSRHHGTVTHSWKFTASSATLTG